MRHLFAEASPCCKPFDRSLAWDGARPTVYSNMEPFHKYATSSAPCLRRMKKSRAAVLSLLLARLLLLVARPCSESDVYPGYPLPKQLSIDAVRPYPQLVGCTELDLANVELSSAEAVLLARCIAFAENGEFP